MCILRGCGRGCEARLPSPSLGETETSVRRSSPGAGVEGMLPVSLRVLRSISSSDRQRELTRARVTRADKPSCIAAATLTTTDTPVLYLFVLATAKKVLLRPHPQGERLERRQVAAIGRDCLRRQERDGGDEGDAGAPQGQVQQVGGRLPPCLVVPYRPLARVLASWRCF